MAQTITIFAKGLIKTQNALGEASDGALTIADNVVISRDNLIETRRGLEKWSELAAGTVKRLFAYGGRLIAWYSNGTLFRLARSSADVLFWSDYSAPFPQPAGGGKMRFAEANGNLYFTQFTGVKRLDSVNGVPEDAGAPQGLEVEVTFVSGVVGTALKGDARYAYRAVWGKKDANRNLILGAPSGRFNVTTPASDVLAGSLARTSGTTVTATVISHGFVVGDKIIQFPGETNFLAGTKTVTAVTTTTFTYAEVGGNVASTQTHRFSLAPVDATLKVTVPPSADSTYFCQVYRSPGSENAEVEPTDNLGLVYEKLLPPAVDMVSRNRVGSTVTVTTASPHGFDHGMHVNVEPSITDFPSGVKQIIANDPTHFSYTESGAAVTSTTIQSAKPVTITIVDTLPDSLLGAALYTNPQEEGILNANTPPPSARELVTFRGCLIYANCDALTRLFVSLLAVGPTTGLQEDDTFTLDGLTYTAGDTEDYNTRTFRVYTNSTPSINVSNTAASICRVINRSPSNTTCVAYIVAGPDDEPGKMVFEKRDFGLNLTWSPGARANAWSPSTDQNETFQTQSNAVYWSKSNQPDSVPLLQFNRLGSNSKRILRCVSTRDSLFILKEDGIWKLTGDAPSVFRFDPVDTTLELIAPDTAVSLDGTVFALTEQGVVRITDNGILVVSRGIEVDIANRIGGDVRAKTAELAFAVAYESDRKYHLWLPKFASSTACEEAYTYDLFTDSWTHRTDIRTAGVVNSVDELMYLATDKKIYQERKTYTNADYVDESFPVVIASVNGDVVTLNSGVGVEEGDALYQNGKSAVVISVANNLLTLDREEPFGTGGALIMKGINVDIEWVPKFGETPGVLSHFREASILFDRISFAKATLRFSSNLLPDYVDIPLDGVQLNLNTGIHRLFQLRSLFPIESSRASQVRIRLMHKQGRMPLSIQGLTVTFNNTRSPRTGK